MQYQSENFTLDTDDYSLTRSGIKYPVAPQVFDLIVFLIENRNSVVTREELLEALWSGRIVSDSAINARLKEARKAVGDTGKQQRVIKTLHRRGYQFIADVSITPGNAGKYENQTAHSAGKNDKPSIAVLPFENLSPDPEQEYFADGVTVDLIETLSKFRHLRTISRYSTLSYKEFKPPIAVIAEQQNVQYIVEGSVRKSGKRIRVSAELVDAASNDIVWSERFDHDLEDLFAVQDELTMSIALAMKVQLDDGEMARVRSKGTGNVRAWELTMAAVDLEDTYILENILKARRLAEEATQLDPGYPYAWVCLGWSHWMQAYIGGSESIEASLDEAEKANNRAIELDPDYAEVWSLRGMINLMRHDAEAALNNSLRAVELEPGSAEFQALAAFACMFAGHDDEALEYHQRGMRLCPIRANWHYLEESYFERARGDFDKAAEIYRQGIAVEPESPLCRFYLIDLLMEQGDEASAQKYADEIRALDKSINALGIACSFSADPERRQAFRDRLAKFDLV